MLPYLVLILFIIYIFYFKLLKVYTYWKLKGIKGPEPQLLLGNMKTILRKEDSIHTYVSKMYDLYPDEKFIGIYQGLTPTLIVKDLDLIKKVLIEDFVNFTDRGFLMSDEPIVKNLFFTDGNNWKMLRQRLTPLFTNCKLKQMMPVLNKCIGDYIKYIDGVIDKRVQDISIINMKYTLKVMTSVLFGLNIDAFAESCQFNDMAMKILQRSLKHIVVDILQNIMPGINTRLGIKLYSHIEHFFVSLVNQIIKEREGKPKVRRDFMDLMIELKEEGTLKKVLESSVSELEITESVIAAQALLFYIGGLEPSSGAMSYLMYEFAQNPGEQERCREEADSVFKKYGDELPYEAVSELQYLNMAFDETLRKYPIAGSLFREAVTDYTFGNTGLTIAKGTKLLIPVPSIHRDSKYYLNPELFDPTRFAKENKSRIHDSAFLAFGDGPRHCIGMMFGRLQSILGVAHFLRNFRVSTCSRTASYKNLRYDPLQYVLVNVDGLWVSLTRR